MNNVDNIINEYLKSRVVTKREMRPRGFDLHDNVDKLIKLQIKKFKREGMSNQKIVDKFSKLIPFLVDEIDKEV